MSGLYIHIPFCRQKCTYCDFVSAPATSEEIQTYLTVLQKEIQLYGQLLENDEKKLTTLFVGGGTPTCLTDEQLVGLLEVCRQNFDLSSCREISLEANPGTVNPAQLRQLRQIGFNRLSLGVQSCQPDLLRVLGRIHTWETARQALLSAAEAGFQNLNADLILGIPGQSLEQGLSCLEQLLSLQVLSHLSLYALQLEPGTPLTRQIESGQLAAMDENEAADLEDLSEKLLQQNGFVRYEISNYARPGRECLHNLNYWRREPYLGLGLAAHSLWRNRRFANPTSWAAYQKLIQQNQLALTSGTILSQTEAISETCWLGLRLTQGIDLQEFIRKFGQPVHNFYGRQIAALKSKGLLIEKNGHLSLTQRGRDLGNQVFAEFV